MSTYDPIEITRLYVFGTDAPSLDDYNLHIRPNDAEPPPKEYNMIHYMTSGAGRYAYPSIFGAVQKFFASNVADGQYTLAQIQLAIGEQFTTGDNSDVRVEISQYGTDPFSADYAERAYIFGSTWFNLDLTNASFKVVNGQKTIENMVVTASDDNFDFDSANPLATIVNNLFNEPTLDPYNLARGPSIPDGKAVKFHYTGPGIVYAAYSESMYSLDQTVDDSVSIKSQLSHYLMDLSALTNPIIIANLTMYFQQLLDDQFLSYVYDNKKIIYGTPESDELEPGDRELSLDSYEGYMIVGGAGNDTITGGERDDHLLGGDGQDILIGNAGNDELEGGAEVDILDGGDGNDQLKGGAGVDVYQLHSNYGSDVITDSDGQGIVLINDVALNSGTYQFQDIYKNTPTNTLVTKVNGGNTLIISQVEPTNSTPNRIIINNWSETNNLNISLTGSAPTPTGNVMNGDFKKDIETNGTPDTADDTYKISTVNGISNYQYGVAEANAKDLMNGTAGNDVMDGKSGDDYLNGKDGNDYIQGGVGGDYIQGGMGKDTLNGGAGDDYIYGSSDMDIDMPNDVNFTKPVNEWSHPQATGFNWTTGYDNGDVYSNGTPDGYTRPTPRNRLADDQSSFIDGGAGNDFIAAGTGADYVHGGADMDVIYGMDKDDILFGDGGNDVIFGDGDENTNGYSVVWTTANNHGNDIVDGGDGDDILYGQGGNDIIFGGNNNDKIWGDGGSDLNVFGGNFGDDYIVGGRGNDELHGGEGNDIIYGDDPSTNEVGDDVIYGGKGADTLIGGGGFDTYHVDKNDTIIDIANVSSASTGKVLFDGLKLTGGYRTPNKTDYTNGAGIFYNLTGTVLQVYGARGNLTINNFANHDLGIHLEEVNTPPAPPTPDVLGSGAVSNLADAAITSTTLNNLLTQFTVGERTEQVAMITQLVDAWADTGGMAESYDDRINGMGVSYPTTMQEFVPYVARYMAFGTVVRTYVPDRNPLGYLEAEARRDLNNSDLTSSFRQLIAAWNQKIHILESFSGKYFLGLPAQQPEPNFNIVANTGGGGNNTISYVLDYPIGISYEQAQLDQYQKDYDSIVSSTYQSLLLQTRFKPVLNLLDFVGDNHQLDFTRVNAYFDGLLLQDATVGVLELIDFNFATDAMFKDTAWQGWVRLGGLLDNVTLTPEVLSAIKLNGGAIVAETFENIGTPEHDHVKFYDELSNNIYGSDNEDVLFGLAGNDNIFGSAGSDILLGGAGEDNLNGGEGNDTLMGGTGNDSMDGGNGSDTFLVGIGDGADIISDYGYTGDPAIDSATVDVLQLAIKSTDITALLRDGDNLVIQSGTGDQVTIIFQLSDYHDYYGYGVEQLQFSDGVTWTHADILARVMTYGTTADDNISGLSNAGNRINGFDGNDLLTGGNVEDMLDGGSGDDTLSGREGDDTLVGGVGNDVMDGGNGNDTFVIGAGAGIDTVSDYGADTDTDVVQLAIKSTDITAFLRDGENLIIQSGTSDQLTIAYQLSTYHDYYGYGVEQLQFSDGVTWTQADILSRVITNGSMADDNISGLSNAGNRINGFDGNDYLYGGNQADVIDGGTGDDTLNGGEGNDTLVGGVGNDVMDGGSGSDTYVIGIGDGVDTITDTGYTGDAIIDSATVDVVQLAIKSTDITALLRVGDDLVIQSGAGDQLTITYQLGYYHDAYGYGIEQLQFSDGVTWTQADIIANVATYGTTGDDNLGGMSSSNNRMYGLEGNDYLYGGNLNDIIDGGAGDDTLNGYEGNDILIGGAGNDALNDSVGSNLFDGGAGDDVIYASTWNELLIGGKGFDTITTSTGYDVISFNKGDGQDIVESSTGADDTISLGGEFAYSDLSLNKSDNNLIIKLGATDQITLKHWYADSSYRSVVNLQVIAEEVTGFTLGGADTLRNNKVETFNFANLVSQFDADVETNAANASNWQLTDARLTAHLQSGSDTAAIGGDLAYQYGRNGNLTGVGLLAAQNVINATSFGQTAQTLNNPSVWSAEVVKLG